MTDDNIEIIDDPDAPDLDTLPEPTDPQRDDDPRNDEVPTDD